MKKIKLIVCALIVSMSFASIAEAKSRGGSFRSGFSSQKRSAPKPAPTYVAPAPQPQTKKTAFGSFGSTDPKAQQNATLPQSQMSKDLNNMAAQSNALKTADTRNNVNEKNTVSENGWFRSGNQNATSQTAGNMQGKNSIAQPTDRSSNQPAGQQTWNQPNNARQGGGLMQGLMWFMVGHTVAQHVNAAPQNQMQTNKDAGWESNPDETDSVNANGIATQQEQEVPAVETESFFMKFVRIVLWAGLIGSLIWVVRKMNNFRHRNVKKTTHYSLGS